MGASGGGLTSTSRKRYVERKNGRIAVPTRPAPPVTTTSFFATSIRVEGRGLPALAGSGMPAKAERGERCLLEHVCYILCVPRGQVPHRPGWGLQALTVRDARTG